MGILFSRSSQNTASKRRADDKVEPWRPKTWPQKGDSTTNLSLGGRKHWPQKGDSTTKLSLGGRKPGPKKAITSRWQTWVFVYENMAPKRQLQADDKAEPWWLKTWLQKGDSTTKLNRGGRKLGPKKAIRRQSWALVAENQAPKRQLQADDKPEPWWLKTWPQKGDGCNLSSALLCIWFFDKLLFSSIRNFWDSSLNHWF